MRSFVRMVAALAAAVSVAGCASLGLGGFKEPVVNFRNLQVTGLGVTGGSLDVMLSVYNPNSFKLEGTRLTYRLMIDQTPLGEGAIEDRFTVQKGDSTVVRVPISFTYSGIGAAARQLMQSGAVPYRVLGDVTVATPVGNFTRPYDRTGRFSTFGGAR